MIEYNIGVDVSKDWLDVHRLPDGTTRRFPNTKTGLRALIAWLLKQPVARIAFEPTGPYHRALERALADAGLPLVKLNPRQARRFAEAIGKLAKTDRADAALLAKMAALLKPDVRPVPSATIAMLKELHLARTALIKDRTAANNRQKALTVPLLKRQAAQRLRHIEAQLAAVEKAIEELILEDQDLAGRLAILVSIPGISKLTAFALLIEMPELGTLTGKQAASLAGLAPVTRQSGGWTGRAFIRGGRANLRCALYMPALVAARFNPDLKSTYDKLLAAGKPAKVALTALMRRLLVLANALLRDGRKWSPIMA